MDVLAFDGRTGAAGDMILGALLAAGADPGVLEPVEDALGVVYDVDTVTEAGIAATDVTVRHADDHTETHDSKADRDHDHDEDCDHDHAGNHDHAGDHDGDHTHDHDGAEGSGPTRTHREVVEVVESMDLPATVRDEALAVFEILGTAEAHVHGTDLDAVAFHEVGADDAIADVVGAALLIDDLGVDRVVTAPVATGTGEVETDHGTYPVPAPAVAAIAEAADWSIRGGPVDSELLTPTGAAVLAHFAERVETLPPVRVHASGYGAGDRRLPDRPNVLRAVVGDRRGRLERESIAVLETNLDDASPELLGGLQDRLAPAGALDVSVVPLTMKKSRPGHLVRVIARPEDAERVARRLAEETGTLGVRQTSARHRHVADRTVETVTIEASGEEYDVRVKVATDLEGELLDVSAEFDDAEAVAADTGLAIREVMGRAERAYRDG